MRRCDLPPVRDPATLCSLPMSLDALQTQRTNDGSKWTCGLPWPRTARNVSPGIFVFWDAHGDVVEAEEVAVG